MKRALFGLILSVGISGMIKANDSMRKDTPKILLSCTYSFYVKIKMCDGSTSYNYLSHVIGACESGMKEGTQTGRLLDTLQEQCKVTVQQPNAITNEQF